MILWYRCPVDRGGDRRHLYTRFLTVSGLTLRPELDPAFLAMSIVLDIASLLDIVSHIAIKSSNSNSNSTQTHLKNSKWLKMAQTHLKMAQTHLKLKMAQTHLKLISKIQNGSKWLKLISKF